VLEAHNIQELDPVGQPFNPHQHEAVGMEDSDEYASGTVTATLQKGYISGERVVRPALVRVAN
jgi:molecular chaperone GrpE